MRGRESRKIFEGGKTKTISDGRMPDTLLSVCPKREYTRTPQKPPFPPFSLPKKENVSREKTRRARQPYDRDLACLLSYPCSIGTDPEARALSQQCGGKKEKKKKSPPTS